MTITPTQADRARAAIFGYENDDLTKQDRDEMAAGNMDDHHSVQEFAAHAQAARDQALDDAIMATPDPTARAAIRALKSGGRVDG